MSSSRRILASSSTLLAVVLMLLISLYMLYPVFSQYSHSSSSSQNAASSPVANQAGLRQLVKQLAVVKAELRTCIKYTELHKHELRQQAVHSPVAGVLYTAFAARQEEEKAKKRRDEEKAERQVRCWRQSFPQTLQWHRRI